MTERVEEIRRQVGYWIKCAAYNQPLMGVEWERSENQRWLDVADKIIEFCATALAQAEREREAALDRVAAVTFERDKLRAEVERLKDTAMLPDEYEAEMYALREKVRNLEAALARVRAALPAEVEKILAVANGLSTRLKGTPEMYEANKIMHAAWAIQAALEGRG